jgi:hypothetical protein
MEGEGEGSLLPLLISPPKNFTQTFHFLKIYLFIYFFFDFNLLLYHGFGRYLRLSSLSLAYKL